MNYLDLFHGIGGFALGAYWAGMKFDNHLCSDIEKYPVELYKKRFPDSIQIGDITKVDWHKLKKDYPGEWILTGGFPCQDISIAGKGRGLIDEKGNKTRSGLWYEYQRGIGILRPKFAVMENVGALLIRGLSEVLGSLSEIGYNAEWQNISAKQIGAQHQRNRIWITAYPEGFYVLCGKKKKENNFQKFRGFKSGSEIKAGFSREYDGLPGDMDRLKGLGNSIVPQIAELLFNQIKGHIYDKI